MAYGRAVRLRSVCIALFVLDLAYCVSALFVRDLPGWKMFEGSERSVYTLRAGEGRAIDAYAWTPASARYLDDEDVVQIARWLCKGRREPLPVRVDTSRRHVVFDAPDCVDRAVE
jgi:hypothetical protein